MCGESPYAIFNCQKDHLKLLKNTQLYPPVHLSTTLNSTQPPFQATQGGKRHVTASWRLSSRVLLTPSCLPQWHIKRTFYGRESVVKKNSAYASIRTQSQIQVKCLWLLHTQMVFFFLLLVKPQSQLAPWEQKQPQLNFLSAIPIYITLHFPSLTARMLWLTYSTGYACKVQIATNHTDCLLFDFFPFF